MKIGILGSGEVGKALSIGFYKHGYEVMIGTEHQDKLNEFIKKNQGIKIGNFSQTAKFGDNLVLCIKGSAAKDALNIAQRENIGKKIILDTTNPISDEPPSNGVLKFFTSLDDSLMERLQKDFPQAKFVKAFNSIGSNFMVNPPFKEKPTMFICGNDDEAKKEVSQILDKFGFEIEDLGKAESARAIEPLCILWCIPGFLRNDWNHAIKLMKI